MSNTIDKEAALAAIQIELDKAAALAAEYAGMGITPVLGNPSGEAAGLRHAHSLVAAIPAAPMEVKPRVKCDWPHCRCHPALCEAPPQPLYTGAFSAPQPAPTLGDALELPEVRALSAALARIADLEAQLATAHADGYAAGVRDALERVTFPIPAYRSAHDSKPSELALTSIAALEAAAEDIVALLPPDSEKGGA